ncbi:hypothetical protein MARA_26070 [Mycolicibacterium arabiense]|uniref:Mycothiol-dependent maleylpyruvate isomerase metal-binding domain-containing protein n=1 Tax=Mycolicibacterium arabiense TaxID=1286181 RepID=A0A7I7RYX1_9MYCO|nr:TIGR03086 family metal-binding protein [Mycolicibacterium arabiense]MCV7373894.1 TIGR03086 family protein [Mycolicibacterium arabiense]BBY49139.1 hypothetical protein MARA_26070 [Mycolicibacterium arabiense]
MPTFAPQHCTAVLASVTVVDAVAPHQLTLPTPCAGWDLAELLTHMTAQHHGFAAAARGHGADADVWRAERFVRAVADDPAGTYAAAARDVLAAFDTEGIDEKPFAMPEFGPNVVIPGEQAIGFHFVDYAVHAWDVAVTIGAPFALPDDVIAALVPVAMAVPDGDFRDADGSPFARALPSADHDDFARVLRHLGRDPGWSQAYSTVTGA